MGIFDIIKDKLTGASKSEPAGEAPIKNDDKPKVDIKKAVERQTYILSITRTNVFLKMNPQDKIIALTKLIKLFEDDFGYTPKKLEKALLELSGNLHLDMKKVWDDEYAKGKGKRD